MFQKKPLTEAEAVPAPTPTAAPKKRVDKSQTKLNNSSDYGKYNEAHQCPDGSVVIMPWNTEEAIKRLTESRYSGDFYRLGHVYTPQKNPFYCGVAAMVIVLNALRLDEGRVPTQSDLHYHHFDPETNSMQPFPYKRYSQMTLLDEETDAIKSREDIAPKNFHKRDVEKGFNPGLTLHEVCEILKMYHATTDEYHVSDDPNTLAKFRHTLTQKLVDGEHFVIINFDGRIIGLNAGGHFAVIGAYHQASDSVLVLDPAAHKTAWYWVPVEHMYHAMNTTDEADPKVRRGYLIVSDDDVRWHD